jgi:arylsulfatase A-like enzyme
MLIPRSGRWLATGLLFVVFTYFLVWLGSVLLRLPRIAQLGAGVLLLSPLLMSLASPLRSQPADPARPNVILIGVDSLRPDHLPHFGAPFNVAPNIEGFIRESVVFSDALTTQAHTFPATASILTGLYPTSSGARGNLFPPALIKTGNSIAWRFQSAGWNTVYATDETRFSNIDEIYGFDRIVGPGIGVPDYLMSFVSDTVLVNLLANTAPGRWLFPHLYGNRAVAHAYRPGSFIRRLELALDHQNTDSLFLYVHFCSAHWPYEPESLFEKDQFKDLPMGDLADTDASYLRAVAAADAQVGQLLVGLRERGRLENTIVVLFSDHGEDFGMKKDLILGDEGDVLNTSVSGHGTSASRESQVRVLLAWQGFGPAGFASHESPFPASLVDIAPTLADLAELPPDVSSRFDGLSLRPAISGDSHAEFPGRVRFVESSRIVRALATREIHVADVLEEAGTDFGFNPEGRVEVQRQFIGSQIAARERAAWSDRHIAVLPWDPESKPVLLDRQLRLWQPAATAPVQSAPLMTGLCKHWQADAVTKSRCEDWAGPNP